MVLNALLPRDHGLSRKSAEAFSGVSSVGIVVVRKFGSRWAAGVADAYLTL